MQDEIAELKALAREDKPLIRVKGDTVPITPYRSVKQRIRDRVLENKKKHEVVPLEEQNYKQVIVNE